MKYRGAVVKSCGGPVFTCRHRGRGDRQSAVLDPPIRIQGGGRGGGVFSHGNSKALSIFGYIMNATLSRLAKYFPSISLFAYASINNPG